MENRPSVETQLPVSPQVPSQEIPSKPKLLKYVFIILILVIFVLIGEGVYYYRLLRFKEPEEKIKKEVLPLLTPEKLEKEIIGDKKSEHPLIVNGDPVTWTELEEAIRYDQEVWQIRGHDTKEEKQLLIDRFVERKLIEQLAQEQNVSQLTEEDLNKIKYKLFGQDYDFTRIESYPEFQAQVRTEALRDKLESLMTKTYSGGLIYVKFYSNGGRELESRGEDSKAKAWAKVKELHSKAKEGIELEELIAEANKDPEIDKLNDGAKMVRFDNITSQEISLPSEEFERVINQLTPGEISEIFNLTTVMRPDLGIPEHYGYGFIILKEESSGEVSNFEQLLRKRKETAEIIIGL